MKLLSITESYITWKSSGGLVQKKLKSFQQTKTTEHHQLFLFRHLGYSPSVYCFLYESGIQESCTQQHTLPDSGKAPPPPLELSVCQNPCKSSRSYPMAEPFHIWTVGLCVSAGSFGLINPLTGDIHYITAAVSVATVARRSRPKPLNTSPGTQEK